MVYHVNQAADSGLGRVEVVGGQGWLEDFECAHIINFFMDNYIAILA